MTSTLIQRSRYSLLLTAALNPLFLVVLFFIAIFPTFHARAIEKDVSGNLSFNTTAPTGSDITNWNTGWGAGGVTGWNYVGTVAGASGVYLRNNWVVTAGHVGAGDFTLGGAQYTLVPASARQIGTADLTLFQIASVPSLPALTIATLPPTAFFFPQAGSSVAMIGYGGGLGETWGLNTVTQINQTVHLTQGSTTYTSTDFETTYGTTTSGPSSVTNNYLLVPGDSGGGDFIYNSTSTAWELAGINEAVDPSTHNSFFVQLSTYASQINTITAAPEPSSVAFLGLGLMVLLGKRR